MNNRWRNSIDRANVHRRNRGGPPTPSLVGLLLRLGLLQVRKLAEARLRFVVVQTAVDAARTHRTILLSTIRIRKRVRTLKLERVLRWLVLALGRSHRRHRRGQLRSHLHGRRRHQLKTFLWGLVGVQLPALLVGVGRLAAADAPVVDLVVALLDALGRVGRVAGTAVEGLDDTVRQRLGKTIGNLSVDGLPHGRSSGALVDRTDAVQEQLQQEFDGRCTASLQPVPERGHHCRRLRILGIVVRSFQIARAAVLFQPLNLLVTAESRSLLNWVIDDATALVRSDIVAVGRTGENSDWPVGMAPDPEDELAEVVEAADGRPELEEELEELKESLFSQPDIVAERARRNVDVV
jgi:hypothetical protein